MSIRRAAVVGAGMAGAAAAQALAQDGVEVVVFDKARGVGGRMATRRHELTSFDHGAQYFTARADAFVDQVERWRERGLAARWSARIARLDGREWTFEEASEPHFVGGPKMSVLARDLVAGLELHCGDWIDAIAPLTEGWELRARDGASFRDFDAVVLAVPAPQALDLLPSTEGLELLARRIAAVEIDPCHAVMVAFEDALHASFDAAFVRDLPIDWVARNDSKPGRDGSETWVLHATPEWSRQHIDADSEWVITQILGAFEKLIGRSLPATSHRASHRWRYARTRRPLESEAEWVAASGLGVCGDWLRGNRVEDAFLSGRALARAILAEEA
jgi:predicted NAD/FAD-dependent oxidoreductase